MVRVLHVDNLLLPEVNPKNLVLDSNIIIQLIDETHRFHRRTKTLIEQVREIKTPKFYYFLATKLEILEYFRKKGLSDHFKDFFSQGGRFGGAGTFDEIYAESDFFRDDGWDNYLSDHEIKKLRHAFFENYYTVSRSREEANKYWKNICMIALHGRFKKMLAKMDDLGLIYATLQEKNLFPSGFPTVKWQSQEEYMIKYGLSSSDAAILNMAMEAKSIDGVITNDLDIIEAMRTEGFPDVIRCYTFKKAYL